MTTGAVAAFLIAICIVVAFLSLPVVSDLTHVPEGCILRDSLSFKKSRLDYFSFDAFVSPSPMLLNISDKNKIINLRVQSDSIGFFTSEFGNESRQLSEPIFGWKTFVLKLTRFVILEYTEGGITRDLTRMFQGINHLKVDPTWQTSVDISNGTFTKSCRTGGPTVSVSPDGDLELLTRLPSLHHNFTVHSEGTFEVTVTVNGASAGKISGRGDTQFSLEFNRQSNLFHKIIVSDKRPMYFFMTLKIMKGTEWATVSFRNSTASLLVTYNLPWKQELPPAPLMIQTTKRATDELSTLKMTTEIAATTSKPPSVTTVVQPASSVAPEESASTATAGLSEFKDLFIAIIAVGATLTIVITAFLFVHLKKCKKTRDRPSRDSPDQLAKIGSPSRPDVHWRRTSNMQGHLNIHWTPPLQRNLGFLHPHNDFPVRKPRSSLDLNRSENNGNGFFRSSVVRDPFSDDLSVTMEQSDKDSDSDHIYENPFSADEIRLTSPCVSFQRGNTSHWSHDKQKILKERGDSRDCDVALDDGYVDMKQNLH